MAQFGFENDIQGILKLDMPITNAPMARWQRKASTSTSSALPSPGKSVNLSLTTSKTPSKTPGSVNCLDNGASVNFVCTVVSVKMLLLNKTYILIVSIGKNKKCTPSKVGGDRFIPIRNGQQMDVASFLLSKENEPLEANNPALVIG